MSQFEAGRYTGWNHFDLMGESKSGRINRLDVLQNALEIVTLSEGDYIDLLFGRPGDSDYSDMLGDVLCLPGVYEFWQHFEVEHLSDAEKRQYLAGFIDGVVTFSSLAGYSKPVKTNREAFASLLN